MRMCTQWKGKQWFLSKDKTQHKCIQNTIYVVSSVLYPSALFPTTKHMKHNNGEKKLELKQLKASLKACAVGRCYFKYK